MTVKFAVCFNDDFFLLNVCSAIETKIRNRDVKKARLVVCQTFRIRDIWSKDNLSKDTFYDSKMFGRCRLLPKGLMATQCLDSKRSGRNSQATQEAPFKCCCNIFTEIKLAFNIDSVNLPAKTEGLSFTK